MKFEIFDIETAPEDSQPLLQKSLAGFGMVPNFSNRQVLIKKK